MMESPGPGRSFPLPGCTRAAFYAVRLSPGTVRHYVAPRRAAAGEPGDGVSSVRAAVLAAVLILSGCSTSDLVPNWTGEPIPDLSQPNYRRIVTENIRTIFPNENPPGDLEISGLRMVDHLKGPAWMTCLKIDAHGKPQLYAIFIQNDKVIDSRASIVLDQCQKESYGPFELPGAGRN